MARAKATKTNHPIIWCDHCSTERARQRIQSGENAYQNLCDGCFDRYTVAQGSNLLTALKQMAPGLSTPEEIVAMPILPQPIFHPGYDPSYYTINGKPYHAGPDAKTEDDED